MSRFRKKVLLITSLCALFAVMSGFMLQSRVQANAYRRRLNAVYVHAFTELVTASEELSSALQKAAYTTPGPLRTSLYEQVYAKALAAQYALGEVPLDGPELAQTAAFFAKTGDYAMALSRQDADDAPDTLSRLAAASQTLTAALLDSQGAIEGGALDLSAVSRAALLGEYGNEAEAGGSGFQAIEADFPELPTLIYDGPFSEHLGSETPKALAGLPDVSAEQARELGAALLGCSPSALTLTTEGEGTLPAYDFAVTRNGQTGYLEITRQGGQMLRYFQNHGSLTPAMTAQEGVERAVAYLSQWGLSHMEPSYHLERDGALTVHFAYVDNGVYCYPDLVKVTVSLADGSLLGYEAYGYLSRHTARQLAPPAISLEDAKTALPGGLTVLSSQTALIPTAGGTEEVLTYELKCEAADGSHILLYLNAQTGQQQNILLLLEDESGTLTL